jgi:hypothetical protein
VPVGSRIRLAAALGAVEDAGVNAVQAVADFTAEIGRGQARLRGPGHLPVLRLSSIRVAGRSVDAGTHSSYRLSMTIGKRPISADEIAEDIA